VKNNFTFFLIYKKEKKMTFLRTVFVFCFFAFSFNNGVFAMMSSFDTENLPIRRSARLIILNSDNQLLLMQIKLDKPADPSAPITKPYWVTLGGGVNPDETLEAAAERELEEETGIRNIRIGQKIWHGQWRGATRINDETYFVVKVPSGITLDHSGLEAEEQKVIKTMRWWNVEDMKNSDEIFIPQRLAAYLGPIIEGNLPSTPLEIDLSTPKEN
jgi:8-oxo-dGTP pyrophosphatase MutT (NUDIX family)